MDKSLWCSSSGVRHHRPLHKVRNLEEVPHLRKCPGRKSSALKASPGVNNNGSSNNSNHNGAYDETLWQDSTPGYLQSSDNHAFCDTWSSAFENGDSNGQDKPFGEHSPVWQAIRREAERDASDEPLLSSYLYASILAHKSFDRALAFVLANRLANPTMLPTQLFEIFVEALRSSSEVLEACVADVEAVRERDPACLSYSSALLYYKGYHALQVHRIAHLLWTRGQKFLALTLQSRLSEVFAVDIHPAAKIGKGVLIDHGTGVVIGETAVIGKNCSILQNVTLGGTGKEGGDRHPKIQSNVLIGASATILGNITVGKGAQVAAGSLVLKPVPPHTMVAGTPAKEVGKVSGNPAMNMEHWSKYVDDPYLDLWKQSPATEAAKSSEVKPNPEAASNKEGDQEEPAPEAKVVLESTNGKVVAKDVAKDVVKEVLVKDELSSENMQDSQSATSSATQGLARKVKKKSRKSKLGDEEPEYFI